MMNFSKDDILKAFYERHACKLFDDKKKIPKEDFDFLLEIGRLSPSSFGMEHWKFLVITSQDLKEKLRPVCWNQPQITTCSHLVAYLAKKSFLKNPDYYRPMYERKSDIFPDVELREKAIKRYENFVNRLDDRALACWSAKQCYIAAANMMSVAAMIGIDSCPIEGFEKDKVEEILGLDTKDYEISMFVAFGYRVNPPSKKYRLPIEQLVEYR